MEKIKWEDRPFVDWSKPVQFVISDGGTIVWFIEDNGSNQNFKGEVIASNYYTVGRTLIGWNKAEFRYTEIQDAFPEGLIKRGDTFQIVIDNVEYACRIYIDTKKGEVVLEYKRQKTFKFFWFYSDLWIKLGETYLDPNSSIILGCNRYYPVTLIKSVLREEIKKVLNRLELEKASKKVERIIKPITFIK